MILYNANKNKEFSVITKTINLRLSEDEAEKLEILAAREKCTKTQVIRKALKPIFDKNFETPVRIELSNDQFQALFEEMDSPPSEEVLERRRYLMEFQMWK